jgi:hypothetical protein
MPWRLFLVTEAWSVVILYVPVQGLPSMVTPQRRSFAAFVRVAFAYVQADLLHLGKSLPHRDDSCIVGRFMLEPAHTLYVVKENG